MEAADLKRSLEDTTYTWPTRVHSYVINHQILGELLE
jgi:hypothetical protein